MIMIRTLLNVLTVSLKANTFNVVKMIVRLLSILELFSLIPLILVFSEMFPMDRT